MVEKHLKMSHSDSSLKSGILNNFLLSFFANNMKYSSSIIAFVNQFNAKTSIFRFEKQKLASLAKL